MPRLRSPHLPFYGLVAFVWAAYGSAACGSAGNQLAIQPSGAETAAPTEESHSVVPTPEGSFANDDEETRDVEGPPAALHAPPPSTELDSDASCVAGPAPSFEEPDGPRLFSIHGYVAHDLRIERTIAGVLHVHCIRVGWPPGSTNNEGAPSAVAARIGASWFRAIENTLARVPWHHVRTLRRIIIDNRPVEHGIAPFSRQSPDDARDGHTMWLHEHLFLDPNHWVNGNHGSYWGYHVNEDNKTFAQLPADHHSFSPILLHELGHLVMYNVVNRGVDVISAPACALTCHDEGTCAKLPPAQREVGCISPYCSPFRFPGSTENFAEQYRFHYQSATTRELLRRSKAGCAELLAEQDRLAPVPHPSPWEDGLPESSYRPSRWTSCQGKACKDF